MGDKPKYDTDDTEAMVVNPEEESVLLSLENVSKSFGLVRALDSISLKFISGTWTYVIGGNGSGKSTLLKVISGDYPVDSGSISFSNREAYIRDFHRLSMCRRSNWMMFLEQDTVRNLAPSMTIYENVILGREIHGSGWPLSGYTTTKRKEEVTSILKKFNLGLEERLHEQVRFLSGGEQQCVVIARILYHQPRILLIDEFTASLDRKISPMVVKMLKEFCSVKQISTIIVTHNLNEIAGAADRLILLRGGSVIGDYGNDGLQLTEEFIRTRFHEEH